MVQSLKNSISASENNSRQQTLQSGVDVLHSVLRQMKAGVEVSQRSEIDDSALHKLDSALPIYDSVLA